MITLLDEKLEDLKQHPATEIRDCKEKGKGYPIEWNEMLGRIFHRVCYKYKDHIDRSLPPCQFEKYL
jgi:predicted transcriptional regulator